VNRGQLDHLIRAAATLTGDTDILVIGSQSVLGTWDEHDLPARAILSIEADIGSLSDLDGDKAMLISGVLGQDSDFHHMYQFYGDGINVSTATAPDDWLSRLVSYRRPGARPGIGRCMEPHDCVISKLFAGRDKDFEFSDALVMAGLADIWTLYARTNALSRASAADRARIFDWLDVRRDRLLAAG
jgi:hypothetical protein